MSSPVPKCQHCILEKQICTSVSEVREGARATKPLERIYVDLCGPMSIPLHSHCLYSMNILDDYSSFVWSLLLHPKDEAAPALKSWLLTLEVQTSYWLQSFITDNGELASSHIQLWCTQKGILHLFTTPYTSTHNGCTEHLHHTLFRKSYAMLSACLASFNLWDEFCTTIAYLTNLTGASANNGKTPYELWHNHKPSLSHLLEIGCSAFALILTNNPKINHCSIPCTLIGYTSNSKAYHLWDHSFDRVFNSFHISFIEQCKTPPPPHNLPLPPVPIPTPSSISLLPLSTITHHTSTSLLIFFILNPTTSPPSTNVPPSLTFPSHPIPSSSSIESPHNNDNSNTLPQDSNPPLDQDIVPNHQETTVPSQQETIPPSQTNDTLPQQNTATPQHIDPTLLQTSNHNSTQQSSDLSPFLSVTPPTPPTTPSCIPVPKAPLCHSPHLATIHASSTTTPTSVDNHLAVFLTKFAPVCDTHYFIPLTLDVPDTHSVDDILTAISSDTAQTMLFDNNDPT